MRLLEPLQGLKIAIGHFMTHLTFFVAMFFVEKDKNYLWPVVKSSTKQPGKETHFAHKDDHHRILQNSFKRNLAEGGYS